MPVVQSYAWMSEKLQQYGLDEKREEGFQKEKAPSDPAVSQAAPNLQEWVSTICSQILQTDAATVAGVAAR
ncbi:MAG: hypothetical protein KBG64_08130, partial [Clostridia bacterium]|nr:hypothetical protein [Clostridia bacterium]